MLWMLDAIDLMNRYFVLVLIPLKRQTMTHENVANTVYPAHKPHEGTYSNPVSHHKSAVLSGPCAIVDVVLFTLRRYRRMRLVGKYEPDSVHVCRVPFRKVMLEYIFSVYPDIPTGHMNTYIDNMRFGQGS